MRGSRGEKEEEGKGIKVKNGKESVKEKKEECLRQTGNNLLYLGMQHQSEREHLPVYLLLDPEVVLPWTLGLWPSPVNLCAYCINGLVCRHDRYLSWIREIHCFFNFSCHICYL